MNIFTKMKRLSLAVAALLTAGTIQAVDVTTSYAYSSTDVPDATNGLTLTLDGVTVHHGPASTKTDGEYAWSYTANTSVTGYTGFISSNDNPRNAAGTGAGATVIPEGGAYVSYKPISDGTIAAAVVANNGKSNFVLEVDGDGNISVASVTATSDFTLGDDGSFTFAEKYYGVVTFNVKANYTYYLFTAGSKMSFYGFSYTYDNGYKAVWSQNFEDETTYSEGFKSGNEGRFQVKYSESGYKGESHALSFSSVGNGSNGTTNTFTPTTVLAEAFSTYKDEYQFDFYYYQQAGSNQGGSGINIYFSTGITVHILAPTNGDATVTVNDGESIGSIPNKTWCHIYINTKDSQTKLRITGVNEATSYVSETVLSETPDVISKIDNPTKRYWGEFRFDDMTLSAPGASEEISDPSLSITAVNGAERTITIIPGIGTVGTEAEATYYTTDGTDPSTTNGTVYTAPFAISTSCTIKAISYLPDGTASCVVSFEAEAGEEISLDDEIINIIGFAENENVSNPIIGYVYKKESVFLSPEVELTVTFNGTEVELPYTITEDGTISATVSATGYVSASESYTLSAAYTKRSSVDFTETDTTNVTELLGENWSVTLNNEGYCLDNRWGNWEKKDGVYKYYNATCSSTNLTDFLATTNYGKSLLIGYGVGQNSLNKDGSKKATNYWISDASEGEIAIYEVNEAQRYITSELVNYGVIYTDDPTLGHTVYDCKVIAKVTVYTPVRELVIDDTDAEGKTEYPGFAPEYSSYSSVVYNRELNTGYTYGLICLPFAPDAESLTNFQFYKLSSASGDAITFEEVDAPEAARPYLYSIKEGATRTNCITGGATTFNLSDPTAVNNFAAGTWELVGSLKNASIDCTDQTTTLNYAFNPAASTLHKVTKTLTVYPYTAYVRNNIATSAATMRVYISGPTGIKEISRDAIEGFDATEGMFDLQGRAMSKPMKGQIYIQNGVKKIKR